MYAELLFRAAADLPPQPVVESSGLLSHAMTPLSIGVVDAPTALKNRAALLKAFDNAVPSAMRR